MIETWERRDDESARAFAAFHLYCEMAEDRSYAKVAEKLGKSETLIARWGRRHNWQLRVLEYDTYVERRRCERNIRERSLMVDRQAAQAKLIQQKCLEGLNALDGRTLKPADIARLFEVATRAEIRARGEPDSESVAAINVTVSLRNQPRYLEAAQRAALEPKSPTGNSDDLLSGIREPK
jgi:hypothetical protein